LLVCHSAGGWLARAALGYLNDVIDPRQRVCGVVTLGAPHLPPPPGVMDMTRGALRFTNDDFPGAYYQQEDVFYITVVGDAIAGVAQQKSSPFEPTSTTGFAYVSYQAVSGVGTTSGDGVVPVSHAHLEGATQLNLPGIFHSINVS
jgi:pimeloyl-ACP methyl ester carboxylesterase